MLPAVLVTNMCTDFIKSILVGHDFNKGNEAPIQKFEQRYFRLGEKAMISAIRDAYNQFEIYKSMKLVASSAKNKSGK
jgi:hypothetical protein